MVTLHYVAYACHMDTAIAMTDRSELPRPRRSPQIRTLRMLAITFLVWLIAFTAASARLARHPPGAFGRGALAALAIASFVAILAAVGRAVLLQDEFTQRVHLVATGWAFAAIALLSYAIYFLHEAGFVAAFPVSSLWMVMGVIWWCSIAVSAWYYR